VLLVPIPLKDRATALPSWGSWKEEAGSPLSIDKGQLIVLVLTTMEKYRRHRSGVTRLLKRAGRALDQEQMAAIAFQSAKGSIVIPCRP
jgi:hypothetical protein